MKPNLTTTIASPIHNLFPYQCTPYLSHYLVAVMFFLIPTLIWCFTTNQCKHLFPDPWKTQLKIIQLYRLLTNVATYKGLLWTLRIHAGILLYIRSRNLQCYYRLDYDTLIWASFILFSYASNVWNLKCVMYVITLWQNYNGKICFFPHICHGG